VDRRPIPDNAIHVSIVPNFGTVVPGWLDSPIFSPLAEKLHAGLCAGVPIRRNLQSF